MWWCSLWLWLCGGTHYHPRISVCHSPRQQDPLLSSKLDPTYGRRLLDKKGCWMKTFNFGFPFIPFQCAHGDQKIKCVHSMPHYETITLFYHSSSYNQLSRYKPVNLVPWHCRIKRHGCKTTYFQLPSIRGHKRSGPFHCWPTHALKKKNTSAHYTNLTQHLLQTIASIRLRWTDQQVSGWTAQGFKTPQIDQKFNCNKASFTDTSIKIIFFPVTWNSCKGLCLLPSHVARVQCSQLLGGEKTTLQYRMPLINLAFERAIERMSVGH